MATNPGTMNNGSRVSILWTDEGQEEEHQLGQIRRTNQVTVEYGQSLGR